MYRVPEPEKRQIHHQVDLWMPEYFMFHAFGASHILAISKQ